MNVALRHAMTVQEFLAWADSQGERPRAELINGQIVSLSPERVKHIKAKFAVALALTTAIARARLPCHALAAGATVRIDEHTAYEPDALVYCGEELAGDTMIVPNPIVVVELLSPTTAHTDTSAKLIGYFTLASVKHYLIVDPDARGVTHHSRGAAPLTLAAGSLRFDPPGLTLEVSDLFS